MAQLVAILRELRSSLSHQTAQETMAGRRDQGEHGGR